MTDLRFLNHENGFLVIHGNDAAARALIYLCQLMDIPYVQTELIACTAYEVLTPIPHDPPAFPFAGEHEPFMQREHARRLALQNRYEVAFVGCRPVGEWNPARTHTVTETGPALLRLMLRKFQAQRKLSGPTMQWFEFLTLYLEGKESTIRDIGTEEDLRRIRAFVEI